MSHNKVTVNNQAPDATGMISIGLDNLSDVTASSPASGQTLRYSGSAWQLGSTTTTLALFGVGASQAYPTGGSQIAAGVDLHFYGVAYNGVGATGTYSGWYDEITLPAGEYVLTAVSGVSMSSSTGSVSYRWYDHTGATYTGTTGIAGHDDLDVGSPAITYVSPTASTVYSVRATAASNVNTLASQGNRAAERGWIEVRKL